MKTAISVPDRIFRQAERHARRTGKSRSELYSVAVAEYLVRHDPDEITARMNEACALAGEEDMNFIRAAARRTFKRVEW